MQNLSQTFLALAIATLFVAELSEGGTCCEPALLRSDYVTTPDVGVHKVHRRKVTWNEARKICMAEGAHLAVLDSAEEEALFKSWISKGNLGGFWIGFHDLFEEGSWTTVTGGYVDSMSYHPWAADEPNNWGNEQHCGILWEKYKGQGADDYGCHNHAAFVCEIDLCAC
ncbi:hemolymph lipopolysaccharide-binding protein-like [Augochlora pura]